MQRGAGGEAVQLPCPSLARRSLTLSVTLAPFAVALALTDQAGAANEPRGAESEQGNLSEEFLGPYFPYGRVASLPTASLLFAGGMLRIAIVSRQRELTAQRVLTWVETRARALVDYFAVLPGAPVTLLLVFVDGKGVRGGSSWGHGGAASRVVIGSDTTPAQFESDWVLVHELVHHAMPSLASEHHWMEEGLATYVEPIVRARAGLMPVQTYWRELVEGLPKGLPAPGDAGLDRTPTWGRTYWGGALYYFLADMEARRRTGNGRSLRDALSALLGAGGNITRSWRPQRVLEVFDSAVGAPVFRNLYDRMSHSAYPVDLDAIWRQLGVSNQNGTVTFDDAAPLAHLRRAMTAS